MATEQCVPLAGSTACQGFNASSISTDSTLKGMFPFLNFVSDATTFDKQFYQYIATTYSQQKYQQLLGCSNVDLSNTSAIYARYTASFLCNAIVQNSVQVCGLTGAAARPLCADSCAAFSISEETIASTPELCGTNAPNALNMIRADFTNCALPPGALTPDCVHGAENEPDNCGFANNVASLCSYCAASSPNSTDSCCLYSGAETRCQNVHLPFTTTMGNIFPSSTATSNSTVHVSQSHAALSAGAIAGIVIGSLLGAILLLALIIGACVFFRRRRERKSNTIFNQPSPVQKRGPVMSYASPATVGEPGIPQGARVHQMVALEGSSSNGEHGSPTGAGYLSSSGYEDTPESQRSGLGLAGAPKRGGSLSRHSDQGLHSSSPNYGSSPEGMASGQSEQMSQFKDYYSSEDIRSGDVVATLWAYQPRAGDEWDLERGDMLKVVGIWDDGWATGYKIRERIDEWEVRRNANRDSGVSNGSTGRQQAAGTPAASAAVGDGEIKAFPHWRKTIEGDGGMEMPGGGGSGNGGSPTGSP